MLVEEAAKRVGMNTQTLRLSLQQGLLPFGIAVKTSEKRYTYKIFEDRLEKYLEGKLLQ
jgi:DNA-binding transcriptional MerR regulator